MIIKKVNAAPAARLVLLGASNLRRSLPTVLQESCHRLVHRMGGPIEVYVAHGHGRSFGQRSSIPFRTLPGILQSQLWNDLKNRSNLPTFALITDVGNDLLLGIEPAELLAWIEECIVQLLSHGAQIIVTPLPMESILGLNRVRYKIFSTFFFPACRLSYDTVCDYAKTTNEGLQKLVARYDLSMPKVQQDWYGADSIHLRRRKFSTAWSTLLKGWGEEPGVKKRTVFLGKKRMSLALAAPQERWLFGIHQRRAQPCLRYQEGSSIAFY